MKRHSLPLKTTANTRSDQPLIIDGNRTTTGDLVIDTTSANAITVKTTSHWEHQGNILATGGQYGLNMESRAVSTIKGNLTTVGKGSAGLELGNHAQLTVTHNLESKGVGVSSSTYGWAAYLTNFANVVVKGKTTLLGDKKQSRYEWGHGLLMEVGAAWISEGLLTAEGRTAIDIQGGTLQHFNEMKLQGGRGFSMQVGKATINGKLTLKGEDKEGILLTQQAQLTLNGPADIKAWERGISVDNSQLAIAEAATIQSEGEKEGIAVLNSGHVTLTAPATIISKGGQGIYLASNATWRSSAALILESPRNAPINITGGARFEHRAALKTTGYSGISLASGGITTINSEAADTATEINTTSSAIAAVYLDDATFNHRGRLTLNSQSYGIQLLQESSQWHSNGSLTITTPAAVVMQLQGEQFKHQGSFTINGGQTIALTGAEPAAELREVVTMTPGSSLSLQLEHPLTVNGMQLANESSTLKWPVVTLSSPQLTVNGVVDLSGYSSSYSNGGHVDLQGGGRLRLEKLICGPGSNFRVRGDFDIRIGEVICKAGGTVQLAFQLSDGNPLTIGHFELPKQEAGKPPVLSLELGGKDLQLSFDVGSRTLTEFPSGTHYSYRASSQQPPIQLISQRENPRLETPNTALLTQISPAISAVARSG